MSYNFKNFSLTKNDIFLTDYPTFYIIGKEFVEKTSEQNWYLISLPKFQVYEIWKIEKGIEKVLQRYRGEKIIKVLNGLKWKIKIKHIKGEEKEGESHFRERNIILTDTGNYYLYTIIPTEEGWSWEYCLVSFSDFSIYKVKESAEKTLKEKGERVFRLWERKGVEITIEKRKKREDFTKIDLNFSF